MQGILGTRENRYKGENRLLQRKDGKKLPMMIFDTEERAKFKELYETYRDYLYWISYNIIKNKHDAEDCVHNSFMKVSKVLYKIDLQQPEKTKMFLTIIAKNTAIDFYRKKKKRQDWEEADNFEEIVDWNRVEENIIDEYNYQCLIKEINNLPEKFRDVLRLRYLFDLTIKEIAEQMSASETNIYARICRAKQLLLEALEKRDD